MVLNVEHVHIFIQLYSINKYSTNKDLFCLGSMFVAIKLTQKSGQRKKNENLDPHRCKMM